MEKQTNVIGKIVIIDGKKAKIIGESGSEITAVFQEHGKYQTPNEEITIAKSQITLLDAKKYPEKYENHTLRNEADVWFAKTQKDLTRSSYDILNKEVIKAKNQRVNVSDIEEQMPALLKQVLRHQADLWLAKTQEELIRSSYNILGNQINYAKKEKVDVSDIEEQMPALLKQILRHQTDLWFAKTQEELIRSSYNILGNQINYAKKEKVDVSDIEEQMPALLKQVLRHQADLWLDKTQEDLSQSSYRILDTLVKEAKNQGVDVSDIEQQLPALLAKISTAP